MSLFYMVGMGSKAAVGMSRRRLRSRPVFLKGFPMPASVALSLTARRKALMRYETTQALTCPKWLQAARLGSGGVAERFAVLFANLRDRVLVGFVEAVFPEVVPGVEDEGAAEGEEADEVGQGHEAVGDVGEVPDEGAARDDAADEGHDDPEDAVGGDEFDAAEVLQGALAEVGPAQQGGDDEGGEADGEQEGADATHGGEGVVGEHFAGFGVDAGVGHDGDGEGEAGEGADDDGVPEGAGGGDEGLLDGVRGAHGGGDDGGGAHAGFVGEEASLAAGLHGEHEAGADEAAAGGLLGEGGGADEADGGPDVFGVRGEEHAAADHVDEGHAGDAGGADARDAFEASEQDEGDEQGENDAAGPAGDAEGGFLHDARDGVALGDVADAEGGDGGEDGEGDAEPAAFHAALDDVHGAADDVALLVLHAVADGEQAFGVAGGHAEEPGEHAPEDGSGAAGGDGDGDADDVAGADVGGQRDHEGGEVGDVAFALVAAGEVEFEGGEEVALREAQDDGEVDVGAQQAEEQDVAPQESAGGAETVFDGL